MLAVAAVLLKARSGMTTRGVTDVAAVVARARLRENILVVMIVLVR